MILVTLGTQKQEFTRLLDYIEKSKIKDDLFSNSEKKYIILFFICKCKKI